MKPMPFNRRAFLKSAVAANAAALNAALPRNTSGPVNTLRPESTAPSRLSAGEQARIRASVEAALAAGEQRLR